MHSIRDSFKCSIVLLVGLFVFTGMTGLPGLTENLPDGVTTGTSKSDSKSKPGKSKTALPAKSPAGSTDHKQELTEIFPKKAVNKAGKNIPKVNRKVSNNLQSAINEIEAQAKKPARATSKEAKRAKVVEYQWKGHKIKSKKVVTK